RRPVGGQIVGDVLAEEGLAGFDVALGVTGAAIAEAAFNPKGEQPIIVEVSRRQLREHSSVTAPLGGRGIDGGSGGQTKIASRMGYTGSDCRFHHVRLIPANLTNLKSDLGLRCLELGSDVLQTNLTVRDEATCLVGDVDSPQLLGAALVEGRRFQEHPPGRQRSEVVRRVGESDAYLAAPAPCRARPNARGPLDRCRVHAAMYDPPRGEVVASQLHVARYPGIGDLV